MDPTVTQIFFNGVRGFYRAVSSTIIKKISFDDNLLDDVAFLLPQIRIRLPQPDTSPNFPVFSCDSH